MGNSKKIFEGTTLNVTTWMLKALKEKKVTADELILVIYLFNLKDRIFNPEEITNVLGFQRKESLELFNSLLEKNIITIETQKDESKKIKEVILFDKLYETMDDLLNKEKEVEKESQIFKSFETEFGRTLSPMEYEIINAWLSIGTSEEIILGALKEATYNGVSNLRYIDKIINEWSKKGYKNMEDVKKNNFKTNDKPQKEIFDYNWLEDDK